MLVCSSLTPDQTSARGCRPDLSASSVASLNTRLDITREASVLSPHLNCIMRVRRLVEVKHSSPSSRTVWQLITACSRLCSPVQLSSFPSMYHYHHYHSLHHYHHHHHRHHRHHHHHHHDQADQRNLTALGHAVTWGQVRWLTIQIITMPGEANNDCDGDADDDGDQDDDNDKGARGCLFGGCWSISE